MSLAMTSPALCYSLLCFRAGRGPLPLERNRDGAYCDRLVALNDRLRSLVLCVSSLSACYEGENTPEIATKDIPGSRRDAKEKIACRRCSVYDQSPSQTPTDLAPGAQQIQSRRARTAAAVISSSAHEKRDSSRHHFERTARMNW